MRKAQRSRPGAGVMVPEMWLLWRVSGGTGGGTRLNGTVGGGETTGLGILLVACSVEGSGPPINGLKLVLGFCFFSPNSAQTQLVFRVRREPRFEGP